MNLDGSCAVHGSGSRVVHGMVHGVLYVMWVEKCSGILPRLVRLDLSIGEGLVWWVVMVMVTLKIPKMLAVITVVD